MAVIMLVLLAAVFVATGETDLAQLMMLGAILAQLIQENLDRR